jgi:WS/DGAT/MGAT family acyltransferase
VAAGVVTIARLGSYDRHCLRVETPERPIHLGILAIVEGAPLRDASGQIRLDAVRRRLDGRTQAVPELRRVIRLAGPLAGGPVWLADPSFSISHHVTTVVVPPPADDAALLALVDELLARPLDRARPLWRLWLVDGLDGDRVGLLLAIHHALADGLTAMRLARSLLEGSFDGPGPGPAATASGPHWISLVGDNVRGLLRGGLALARLSTWRRALELGRGVRGVMAVAQRLPASVLNAPVGPRRRTMTLRLDAVRAKRVARAHGCGVNDVILSIIAGGVRALLDARGEPVHRLRPRAGVAVALFSAGRRQATGNDIGSVLVPLPIDAADPRARVDAIARERAGANASPMVAVEPLLRAWLGRLPAYRRALERQRLINLTQTYLPGPSRPIEVLGARVIELIPFAPLAGNLGLSFVALSYAGSLGLTVRADADAFPDLGVLAAAMEREWRVLESSTPARAAAEMQG